MKQYKLPPVILALANAMKREKMSANKINSTVARYLAEYSKGDNILEQTASRRRVRRMLREVKLVHVEERKLKGYVYDKGQSYATLPKS